MKTFKEFLGEKVNYSRTQKSGFGVKVSVGYIDPMTKQRQVEDIYFKSKMDALGFKDKVTGFPKGAEVEAIKELK